MLALIHFKEIKLGKENAINVFKVMAFPMKHLNGELKVLIKVNKTRSPTTINY